MRTHTFFYLSFILYHVTFFITKAVALPPPLSIFSERSYIDRTAGTASERRGEQGPHSDEAGQSNVYFDGRRPRSVGAPIIGSGRRILQSATDLDVHALPAQALTAALSAHRPW